MFGGGQVGIAVFPIGDGAAVPAGATGRLYLSINVVDLVGVHERAYLEDCRRDALARDKAETAPAG